MIKEGQIVLFRFPQADLQNGKLRPALIIRKLTGRYNDWPICMISTKLDQEIPGFDEMITLSDSDFAVSGLKVPSLIRISRLAVVNGDILLGEIGQIDNVRLNRIKQNLSSWLQST